MGFAWEAPEKLIAPIAFSAVLPANVATTSPVVAVPDDPTARYQIEALPPWSADRVKGVPPNVTPVTAELPDAVTTSKRSFPGSTE